MLNIYQIVVVKFLVTDKANESKFFKNNFVLANIISKIVFEISLLILSNANIDFLA